MIKDKSCDDWRLFSDSESAVCAVSGAQFLTRTGWSSLKNDADNDVPFSLYRDEGKMFLQVLLFDLSNKKRLKTTCWCVLWSKVDYVMIKSGKVLPSLFRKHKPRLYYIYVVMGLLWWWHKSRWKFHRVRSTYLQFHARGFAEVQKIAQVRYAKLD